MSSLNSSSMSGTGKDPYAMSLEIAEKIISSLNDKTLVARYFEQKNRIMSSSPTSSVSSSSSTIDTGRAFQSYQKFVSENQALKEELARIQSEKPDFSSSPDNMTIAKLLRELQLKIHKDASPGPIKNAVDELDNLRKVVDATLDTLTYLRTGLQDENNKLKKELNECTQELNIKLDAAREKEARDNIELENNDAQLEQEVADAEEQLAQLKAKLDQAKSENEQLLQQHSASADLLEQMEKEMNQTEANIANMESESEKLYEEIDDLKHKLTVKNKEFAKLQTLQRFGEMNAEGNITDEIERLRKRSQQLKSENAQIAFEIKRLEKKSSGSIIDQSTVITMDEDELAAQILRSKLH